MFTPSNTRNTGPAPRSSQITPPSGWLRRSADSREPVNKIAAFNEAHREADERLRAYHERDRKGSIRLSQDALTELDPSQSMDLPCNNLRARLKFAETVMRHCDAACGALPENEPVFFFTFISHKHIVREDEAADFSIRRLHSLMHWILRGYSYVGMVEGAFFGNLNAAGAAFQRGVSYHTHAIVWGCSEAELAAIRDAANARYRTIIAGIDAAHYRLLSRAEVAGQALYMCKGQLSEYRVWPRKGEVIDRETGEITIVGTGRFRQAKRRIRSGDMARMYNIFAGRRLDQLAFAGGGGQPVLGAIRHEAFADSRAWENRETSLKAGRQRYTRQPARRQASRSPGRIAPRRLGMRGLIKD